MALAAETRVGPFEVLSLLGAGGMGEVYRARDTRLGREVALKVLPAATLTDDSARARLLREARLASQLNHPHICTIHEVGEAVPSTDSTGSGQAVTYIAMELVEGQPLSARLADGPLPTEQLLRFGSQVADALAHAHGHGVVHRGLKSANVVITPEGRAKVLDFGLAKRLDEQKPDAVTRLQTSLTEPGMVVGTLSCMAPEQLRGEPADARSDIWALGVVLFEMAAGARLFQGQTGFALTSAILKESQPPVPAEVGATITRCLEKEPGRRYQHAGEVRAALDAIQAGTAAPWAVWGYRLARRRRLLALAAGAVAVVGGLATLAAVVALDVGGLRTRLTGGGAPAQIRLAVLPFENGSGDPEQDYLSDGMTDELITSLGRLNPAILQVVGRTSVWRYKKRDTPIDQIGRDLRLDYVLEGSAQREADRLHIRAALIQVRDQTQRWAETYDKKMADIVALQSDVAKQVAVKLALTLLPAEEARLEHAPAVNPEAYDAWLKGTQARVKLTREGLETAERYFNLALEKDPTYAAAWAGIARVWTGRQQALITTPSEAAPKAKAAALKALALDENSWDAHRALAGILTWTDWDWPVAEREWNRLLALNPNSDALSGHSHFLMSMRRPEEALAQATRAVELDPFDVKVHGFYAAVLNGMRRYDDAIAAARATLELQPGYGIALNVLHQALLAKGKYDESLAQERKEFAGDRELLEALEQGYAEGGWAGSQRRLAAVWAARYGKPGGVGPLKLADAYREAGDRDRALEWLERGYEEHNPNMPYVGGPHNDSLRADPRFQDLLRRMNLPR